MSMKYPNRIGSKKAPILAMKFTIPKPLAANSILEAMDERKNMGPNSAELMNMAKLKKNNKSRKLLIQHNIAHDRAKIKEEYIRILNGVNLFNIPPPMNRAIPLMSIMKAPHIPAELNESLAPTDVMKAENHVPKVSIAPKKMA